MDVNRIDRAVAKRVKGALRLGRDSVRYGVAVAPRLVEVAILRSLRRTDYRRWTAPDSLEAWWDARTQLLAELVPAGSRVIEFGAGRRQLERFLDPTCAYVPSDLVDRGAGTIVCDLNERPLPDLKERGLDVAVFGGVLEYIVDVPALVEWLAGTVRFCVASYAYVAPKTTLVERLADSLRRTRFGYMNHFSEEQFIDVFRGRGFAVRKRRVWEAQRLFLFARAGTAGAGEGAR